MGNDAELGQVILSLLVNAAGAIPEDSQRDATVTVSTSLDTNGQVVIAVADTGCGIASELHGRVFTPFFTTKPVSSGTGFGLSIAHKIVASLGGEISFTSEAGRGSEFRLALPSLAEPPRRCRVLVVDDDPLMAAALKRGLCAAHDVTVCEHGAAALSLLSTQPGYDLIVCDVSMPGVSGMDIHAELCRRAPEQADRLLFVSGGVFTPRVRDLLASIKNECVEKPFDMSTLQSIVHRLIVAKDSLQSLTGAP